jgi:hypothetical protein
MLTIAKLKRERWGQSALDQIELELKELEAIAAEDAIAADAAEPPSTRGKSFWSAPVPPR